MSEQLDLFPDFGSPPEDGDLDPNRARILAAAAALLDGSATDALQEYMFHKAVLSSMFETWPQVGAEIAARRGYKTVRGMIRTATDLEMRSILVEAFLALLPIKERAPTVIRLVQGMGIRLRDL